MQFPTFHKHGRYKWTKPCLKDCTLLCDKGNYGSFVVHVVVYCTPKCDMSHMQIKHTKPVMYIANWVHYIH